MTFNEVVYIREILLIEEYVVLVYFNFYEGCLRIY